MLAEPSGTRQSSGGMWSEESAKKEKKKRKGECGSFYQAYPSKQMMNMMEDPPEKGKF